jgi:hypothetical protein
MKYPLGQQMGRKNWGLPCVDAALMLATMQPVAQFRRTQKIMQLVA